MKIPAPLALALALAATPLAAQRTWVVDQYGHGDFLDIPPAVAAASAGDAILVIGVGPYSIDVTVDKPLVLMSDSAPRYVRGNLQIVGLSANEKVVVSKFGHFTADEFRCEVRDCAGTVVIDGVAVDGLDRAAGAVYPGIAVTGCDHVSIRNCIAHGGPAVSIRDSKVALGTTEVRAHHAATALGAPLTALDVERSWVDVTNATCVGGDGSASRPRGGDAASVRDGNTRFSRSELRAGVSSGTLSPFSLFVQRSAVDLNDGQWLGNDLHGPTHLEASQLRRVAFPLVGAWGWSSTLSQLRVTGEGDPGTAFALFVGLDSSPQQFPLGYVWLDPNVFMLVHSGVFPAVGTVHVDLAYPLYLPRGTTLVFQGATLPPNAGLSNPSFAVYERHF